MGSFLAFIMWKKLFQKSQISIAQTKHLGKTKSVQALLDSLWKGLILSPCSHEKSCTKHNLKITLEYCHNHIIGKWAGKCVKLSHFQQAITKLQLLTSSQNVAKLWWHSLCWCHVKGPIWHQNLQLYLSKSSWWFEDCLRHSVNRKWVASDSSFQ